MRYTLIVWYVILLHTIAGISVLLSASPIRTATLSPFYGYASNYKYVGLLLLLCAALAFSGLAVERKHPKLAYLLFAPQHLVILISGLIAFSLAYRQQYADGVQRPFLFIFTDQLPSIALVFFYTFALIQPYLPIKKK